MPERSLKSNPQFWTKPVCSNQRGVPRGGGYIFPHAHLVLGEVPPRRLVAELQSPPHDDQGYFRSQAKGRKLAVSKGLGIMRTLICALLLSTAAYCQVGDSNTTIPEISLSGRQADIEVIDFRIAATANNFAVPGPAISAIPKEVGAGMPSLNKTASGLSLTKSEDPPTARTRQIWYSMAFVAHGAAAFDGWTTRQVISTGKDTKLIP
jgi:hypothetical protein